MKPNHIAIILDGNRRYSTKKGLAVGEGHRKGAENVANLIGWCQEAGIAELTLYSFSMDNFNRSEKEKQKLFGLFMEGVKRLKKDPKFTRKNIQIRFVGRIHLFPPSIYHAMKEIMRSTAKNTGLQVNFAMAYGGKAELLDAIKAISTKVQQNKYKIKNINEKTVEKHLYNASKPDIFIRPGGEKRLSDFLIWQSAYSELFFSNKLWPEFTKKDFQRILKDYAVRERRFGK